MFFKYIQSWKQAASNFTLSAIIFALSVLLFACNQPTKELPLFEALSAEQTGIQFENKLHPNEQFNMFHYMYYYNTISLTCPVMANPDCLSSNTSSILFPLLINTKP